MLSSWFNIGSKTRSSAPSSNESSFAAKYGEDCAAVAFILLAITVLTFPIITGKEVFFYKDMQTWFYPMHSFLRESLLNGEVPLWIPDLGMGMPFLGDPGNSVLYPLNIIFLLPAPACFGQFLVAHDVLAALGAYLLLRQLKLRPAAAAFGALSYGLSGYLLCMMSHSGLYIMSIAWMPLIAALGLRMVARRRPLDLALFGLAFGCQILTGEIQGCVLTGFLLGSLVLVLSPRRLSSFGWLFLGGFLGLLLAAPQIISTLQLLPLTSRGEGMSFAEISSWSLHPMRAAELLVSGIWGLATNMDHFLVITVIKKQSILQVSPWTSSAYCGSLSLIFMVFGLTRLRIKRHGWVLALAVLGVFMLLLSFGEHTPVFGAFHSLIPGVGFFRYPAKYFSLVTLCIAMLGAFGLECLLKTAQKKQRSSMIRLSLIWGGFCAVIFAGALILPVFAADLQVRLDPVKENIAASIIRTACLMEGSLLLVFGLLFFLVFRKRANWLGIAIPLFLFVQLVLVNHTIVLTTSKNLYEETPLIAKTILEGTEEGEPPRVSIPVHNPTVYYQCRRNHGEHEEVLWRAISLRENTGILHGIEYTDAYAAVRMNDRDTFWESNEDLHPRIMVLLSVKHFLFPLVVGDLSGELVGRILEDEFPCMMVYRGKKSFPIARPVRGIILSSSLDDSIEKIGNEEVLVGDFAVIQGLDNYSPKDPHIQSWTELGECMSKRSRGSKFETQCDLVAPSWVVINTSFHKGWRGAVDGKHVPVYRANGIVMAVQVPAGSHKIELQYQEPWLAFGFYLSGFALLLCGVLISVSIFGKPKKLIGVVKRI